MNIDIEALKAAALAAWNEPWAVPDDTPIAQYAAVANPAAVLALIERLEQAESAINNPRLTGLHVHDNMVSMGMEGAACQAFAEAFAEQFRRNGASNYVEMHFDHSDAEIGPLVVTLQRKQGKTPHQLRAEAEARADRAERNRDMWKGQCERQAEALASERAANAMLTEENERLQRCLTQIQERMAGR